MAVTVSSMFIPVHDPDAAVGFYRDALGLEVTNDVVNSGFRWITVRPPDQDVSIVLFQPHGGRSQAEGDALERLMLRLRLSGSVRQPRPDRAGLTMKTMTCKQLGGPCDHAHHANTADEAIKAQDQHLKDAVAAGDAAHESANREMRGRWKHPIAAMGWYRQAKRDFAALAED